MKDEEVDYLNWKLEEIRISGYQNVLLKNKNDVLRRPKWTRSGWDGDSPMAKTIEDTRIQLKFFKQNTIINIWKSNELLFDKGSVPSIIPDSIADDEGWLWQLIGYLVHDLGYACNYLDRSFWDMLLREINLLAGTDKAQVNRIYRGVRMFGWSCYKTDHNDLLEIQEKGVKLDYTPRFTLFNREFMQDVISLKAIEPIKSYPFWKLW